MKNVSAFLKRHSALLLLVLVLATVPAGIAFGKYVKSVNVTDEISITVEAEDEKYTIDKEKMWTALRSLKSRGSLSVNFCTYKNVPTAAIASRAETDGIQSEDSGGIGVYYNETNVYIAPVNNETAVMTAPPDCSYFLTTDDTFVTAIYGVKLSTVDFSNLDTSGVKSMFRMFDGCSDLTTFSANDLFNTTNVTNMSRMFNNCPSLRDVDVSAFNTSNVTNMQGMFNNCKILTSLDLSSFDTSRVTDMSWMFCYAEKLESIKVDKDFNTDNVTNSMSMFTGCSNLVGGAGTAFSASHVDKEYARIDGGPNSATPGYFTDKNATSTSSAIGSIEGSGISLKS